MLAFGASGRGGFSSLHQRAIISDVEYCFYREELTANGFSRLSNELMMFDNPPFSS